MKRDADAEPGRRIRPPFSNSKANAKTEEMEIRNWRKGQTRRTTPKILSNKGYLLTFSNRFRVLQGKEVENDNINNVEFSWQSTKHGAKLCEGTVN